MSAQKIQLTGPDGKPQEYPVYTDNRELAKDYAAGGDPRWRSHCLLHRAPARGGSHEYIC